MCKLLLLLPLALGCSLLQRAGSAAFDRPTLSFKEARLPHVDFQGAELDLVFLVTNPNAIGLDLTRASYNLEVEGHPVASGAPKNGLQIPARGTTEVTFPAQVLWNEIAPALEAVVALDQIHYKASGELGVGPVTLPLQHEGTRSRARWLGRWSCSGLPGPLDPSGGGRRPLPQRGEHRANPVAQPSGCAPRPCELCPEQREPGDDQRPSGPGQHQQGHTREQEQGASHQDPDAARAGVERVHAPMYKARPNAGPPQFYSSSARAAAAAAASSACSARRLSSTSARQRSRRARISISSPFPPGS